MSTPARRIVKVEHDPSGPMHLTFPTNGGPREHRPQYRNPLTGRSRAR